MFCSKCGAKVQEEAQFCPQCGEKTVKEKVETRILKDEKDTNRVKCPKCGSHNLQYVTESTTAGGNLSGIVPQNKHQMIISTTHQGFWVCFECGNKFKSLDTLEKEIQSLENSKKVGKYFTIAGLVFLMLAFLMQDALTMLLFGFCGFVCLPVGAAIWLVYGNTSKINKLKEECENYKR